jgi:biopolymer transport protein ExbD
MQLKSKLRLENTIPMASMADIAFLLIIFFLLTSTFARDRGLDIKLPRAATSQQLPKQAVTVQIGRDGELRLNGQPVQPQQFQQALAAALAKTSLKKVNVRADEDVAYGRVFAVVDIARLEGAQATALAGTLREGGSRPQE